MILYTSGPKFLDTEKAYASFMNLRRGYWDIYFEEITPPGFKELTQDLYPQFRKEIQKQVKEAFWEVWDTLPTESQIDTFFREMSKIWENDGIMNRVVQNQRMAVHQDCFLLEKCIQMRLPLGIDFEKLEFVPYEAKESIGSPERMGNALVYDQ